MLVSASILYTHESPCTVYMKYPSKSYHNATLWLHLHTTSFVWFSLIFLLWKDHVSLLQSFDVKSFPCMLILRAKLLGSYSRLKHCAEAMGSSSLFSTKKRLTVIWLNDCKKFHWTYGIDKQPTSSLSINDQQLLLRIQGVGCKCATWNPIQISPS
jgi:hypothetical protein